MRTSVLLALAAAALLAFPAVAHGKIVVRKDGQGRPITFDVRAPGVDLAWYTRHLRRSLHGDEISAVTVRIVRRGRIERLCGRGSEACYRRDREGTRIIVPKGRSSLLATVFFHEYGHHVDVSYGGVRGVPEMNGTAGWWQARNMGPRLANGKVAIGYALGWKRSVGEIFAEDYARLHTKFSWQIRWIGRPSSAVLQAIRADIAAGPCGRRCSVEARMNTSPAPAPRRRRARRPVARSRPSSSCSGPRSPADGWPVARGSPASQARRTSRGRSVAGDGRARSLRRLCGESRRPTPT